MMTLAINTPITEQDIKHVLQSNDLYKLYTVHFMDLQSFVPMVAGTLLIYKFYTAGCDQNELSAQSNTL